jgi:glycosyltransferase involved in cell wall biosynthesis
MPKISIIIPIYNAAEYLAECLDSVLAQTLADIEVICINDGSKDKSGAVLDEYARKDSRITAIHQENAGVSAARNAGLDNVTGQYILFVDSDDTVHPQLCEKVYHAARKDDADLVVLFSDNLSSKKENIIKKVIQDHNRFSAENQPLYETDMLLLYYCAVWGRLWNTSYLNEHHIRFPVGVCCEDLVVNWHGMVYEPKISVVPEKLYNYRQNPASLMHDKNRGYGRGIAKTMECIKAHLVDSGHYAGAWKEVFLHQKLILLHAWYNRIAPQFRAEMRATFVQAFGADEREYLRTHKMSGRFKDFFLMLDGDSSVILRYYARQTFAALGKSISLPIRAVRNKLRRVA